MTDLQNKPEYGKIAVRREEEKEISNSRRRLLKRTALGLPAVMTLHHGSATAMSSIGTECFHNPNVPNPWTNPDTEKTVYFVGYDADGVTPLFQEFGPGDNTTGFTPVAFSCYTSFIPLG